MKRLTWRDVHPLYGGAAGGARTFGQLRHILDTAPDEVRYGGAAGGEKEGWRRVRYTYMIQDEMWMCMSHPPPPPDPRIVEACREAITRFLYG